MLERRQIGSSTFVVFDLHGQQEEIDKVSMMMINNNRNQSSGFAPVSLEEMNGKCSALLFDITGRIALGEYLRKNITQEAFRAMILNLVNTIDGFDEYMISADQVLMDPDVVYINELDQSISFLCLTLKGVKQENNLAGFFREIVQRCTNVSSVGQGISFFNRAWNLVSHEEGFSLENLRSLMTDTVRNEKTDAAPVRTPVEKMADDGMRDDGTNLITVDKAAFEQEEQQKLEQFKLPEPPAQEEKKGLLGKLFGSKDKSEKEKAEKQDKKAKAEKPDKKAKSGFQGGLAGFKKNKPETPDPDQPLPPIGNIPPIQPVNQANNQVQNNPAQNWQAAPVSQPAQAVDAGSYNQAPNAGAYNQTPVSPVNATPREAVPGGTVMLGRDTTPAPAEESRTVQLSFGNAELQLLRAKSGETVVITKNETLLGRDEPDVDVNMSYNKAIGRRHAKAIRRGTDFFIVDLNSTNGTFVNDKKLTPNIEERLKDGDKLCLGNEIFFIRIKG